MQVNWLHFFFIANKNFICIAQTDMGACFSESFWEKVSLFPKIIYEKLHTTSFELKRNIHNL